MTSDGKAGRDCKSRRLLTAGSEVSRSQIRCYFAQSPINEAVEVFFYYWKIVIIPSKIRKRVRLVLLYLSN